MNIQESFPSKFLKAADLKGRHVTVTIERVDMEPVGQSKDMKPVIFFRGKEKGMVLNKTNANTIMKITESPVTEEWIGQQIILYPTETSFQGEQVDCVRIKAVSHSGLKSAARHTPPPRPMPVDAGDDTDFVDDDSDPIPF